MLEQGNLQGWQADPFGLHEKRYFSGGRPTKLVRDGGAESYDEPPVENSAPPPEAKDAADIGAADTTAIGTDAVEKADQAVSAADSESAVADAPTAHERVPDEGTVADEDAVGAENAVADEDAIAAEDAVAADCAAADVDEDLSGFGLSVPGLDVLRRGPRGLVYGTVAVAAVAIVIAIIAITGGFSPHPQPGTFGALAQAGSSPASNTAPLDTSAAAVVTASAQGTLAQKTSDVKLSGSATGAGPALALQGTGQVDFGAHAITASLAANYQGSAVAENVITTGKSAYLELSTAGHSLIVQSTGRHWMNIPLAQGADLSENITAYSLPWSLKLLAQQPASVTSIGTKNIGGVNCKGYIVTPSQQSLLTVVQQEWAYLGLNSKARGAALQSLQKEVAAPITAWFDPARHLACEMTVDMQLTNSAPATWSKQPTAGITQITADFTHYGVPVRITPPAASDSILF